MVENRDGLCDNFAWKHLGTSADAGFLPCRDIDCFGILFLQTKEMVELYCTVCMFVVHQYGAAGWIWL